MDLKTRTKIEELIRRVEAFAGCVSAIRDDLTQILVDSLPAVPDGTAEKVDSRICLMCGKQIKSGRRIRGLHEKCYRSLKRAIDQGIQSESDLIAAGKILAPGRSGRPPNTMVAGILDEIPDFVAQAKKIDDQVKKSRRRSNEKTK